MKKISGRVLVKETNEGIPDLVVAVFDLDTGVHEPRDQPPPREVELSARTVGLLRNRLGSVLTDADGNFNLPIDEETAQHYGHNRLPDLVITVLAPEESDQFEDPIPATFQQRLLHYSRSPRSNAGPFEAYVIRISQKRLLQLGIPWGKKKTGPSAAEQAMRYSQGITERKTALDAIKATLKDGAQAAQVKDKDIRLTAGTLFRGLTAASKAMQDHPHWVGPGGNKVEAHTRAMTAGLERLKGYEGGITMALGKADMKALGLKNTDGDVTGSPSAAKLTDQLDAFSPVTGLVKMRWLSDVCIPAEDRLEQVDCLKNHPIIDHAGHEGGGQPPPPAPPVPVVTANSAAELVLNRVAGQVTELSAIREDGTLKKATVETLLEDIKKLRLKGGPADATAYHDFHSVQVAFKHVWSQAFDGKLRDAAEALYKDYVRLHDDAGVELPEFVAMQDVAQLKEFIKAVRETVNVPEPAASSSPARQEIQIGEMYTKGFKTMAPIGGVMPGLSIKAKVAFMRPIPPTAQDLWPEAEKVWDSLSPEQQLSLEEQADKWNKATTQEEKDRIQATATAILSMPAGPADRLVKLLTRMGQMLAEPYAFDVFAPGTYNFGIMSTYRQRWEPLDYQAGNLVATIPLAPGETRKYSKRTVVKKTRAEKEVERSMSSRSEQSSQTGRAESEIMKKANSSTNFKMTSQGSFNIGIGSFSSGTEFATNQEQFSATNKKDFHEATLKAAEEYRLERSLEIDTTVSMETEETSSGEISNPNNEIPVTYLFYELQRQYRISEHLHRVRPVILVAMDVPSPHEIDEAWLISKQWILSRVILDDMFRPALEYLSSGFAGDEVAIKVIQGNWETQRRLVATLESQTSTQLKFRDDLRQFITESTRRKAINEADHSAMNFLFDSLRDPIGTIDDFSKNDKQNDYLEANRKAAEARLVYADEALADAQKKLQQATSAFEHATRDLSAAMQKQYSRHVAIDQLRIHVKENILYYMQAIWDHEVPDQRFFEHYKLKVRLPKPDKVWKATVAKVNPKAEYQIAGLTIKQMAGTMRVVPSNKMQAVAAALKPELTIAEEERDLVEVADLDNPLGYKGNYIIYPLKESSYITTYMMQEYVDEYFGVRDPHEAGNYTIEELGCLVNCVNKDPDATDDQKQAAKDFFIEQLSTARAATDIIIVPTGQLFIEALPGAHAVLEDFKLLHRAEDVRKVRAEVRHAEMENLRLAARLIAGEREDPDVEKRIVVDKGVGVVPDA